MTAAIAENPNELPQSAAETMAAVVPAVDLTPEERHKRTLFNSDRAREAALKRHNAERMLQIANDKPQEPQDDEIEIVEPDTRTKATLAQIEQCDRFIDACTDALDFMRLTASKERLWKLIIPTAGVHRPKSDTKKRRGGAR